MEYAKMSDDALIQRFRKIKAELDKRDKTWHNEFGRMSDAIGKAYEALTFCPECHHRHWPGRRCGHINSSGPCNSDWDYCACTVGMTPPLADVRRHRKAVEKRTAYEKTHPDPCKASKAKAV